MIELIANSGIQYHELPNDVVIDLNANVMKGLRFYELEFDGKVYLEPTYYFAQHDKYLRRSDLIAAGCMDESTNRIVDEEMIPNYMNWLDVTDVMNVSRPDVNIGDKRKTGLEQIENRWLPIPFYRKDFSSAMSGPISWCRMKLIPIPEKSDKSRKVYKGVLAFDTTTDNNNYIDSPYFQGEPSLDYALCGLSYDDIGEMPDSEAKSIKEIALPLKAYEFCNPSQNTSLNIYLQDILNSTDINTLPKGSKMKYIAYYTYLICYIHHLRCIPDVRLYNNLIKPVIHTTLVLDVGNSRTFGLLAEDPLDASFSKASILELRDLENGNVYSEPFDMRLCFKEENFGISFAQEIFKWPSILRLGKEAARHIYTGDDDLLSTIQFETNYSSPKRFLWDNSPHYTPWKFVSAKEWTVGPSKDLTINGIVQQFKNDGTFTEDPNEIGGRTMYSRSSLMTFCFIEILLHAQMQINSMRFREKNGNSDRRREIKRVILTCPTGMSRQEQKRLRRCMEEATIVLKRYYSKTYNERYDSNTDYDKIEIVPSVRDLSFTLSNIDNKRHWNYDEATCSQMVYMYSEMRRYLGNMDEFFKTYGRRRNNDKKPSITVASLDIGAGTTDIMICNYQNSGVSITPKPLFWDSFQIAGDDLIKRIIVDVILDEPKDKYPNASGIIKSKLRQLGVGDVSERMHHFFSDTANMGAIEKRMRKEFMVQVMHPIANYLLDMLQRGKSECLLKFEDIFKENKPSESLLSFFKAQMGFGIEEVTFGYSPEHLNEIICKVFEPYMRKWAALFYSYKCDIVLLAGRPCALGQMYKLMRRLHPVTPNRLISMNDYRVGSWYPGASDLGRFRDKKSMVAVGALISYLAEIGKLGTFKISTDYLRTKVQPTTEFVGIMNPETVSVERNILTPDLNAVQMDISALPVCLGCRQFDVPGYPANMMYMLRFNENELRKYAIEKVKQMAGLPADTPENAVSPNRVANEVDTMKARLRNNSPLIFRFEREYREDKEFVRIESVESCNHDELPTKYFELALQTWSEENTNWLDTGIFKMHIND